MNKKTKFIINIVAAIIVIVVLSILAYINVTSESYKYKLELDNLTFYSDENIFQKLEWIKDSNIIAIVVDNTNNSKYELSNAILFRQIFAYKQKQTQQYIITSSGCVYSDENRKTHSNSVEFCNDYLSKLNYPVIKIGEIKNNKKTNIIIKNNTYNIIATNLETAYYENHNFLEKIYPNITEIENTIKDFVSNVTNKYQTKNILPK